MSDLEKLMQEHRWRQTRDVIAEIVGDQLNNTLEPPKNRWVNPHRDRAQRRRAARAALKASRKRGDHGSNSAAAAD